jgi:hypothetical protein
MLKKIMTNKILLGILAAAAVGAAALGTYNLMAPASPATFPKGYAIGIWQWQAPTAESPDQMATDADTLKAQGITDVYIDISSYIDADEQRDPQQRQQKTAAFTQSLQQEASTLSARGLKAHALAGNTRWSDPDYWYVPHKLLDYLKSYNGSAKPDQQLSGIQFDIEFYNDKHFNDDPQRHIADYLTLANDLIMQHKQLFTGSNQDVSLGFVVPSWFDGSNPDMPKLSKPITFQLIDQLKQVPSSTIALMAYRRQVQGGDGTAGKAAPTLAYAKTNNSSVKILIGQETTDVKPAKITFFGGTKDELKQAVTELQTTFTDNTNLAGFAFNDQEGFIKLRD